MEPIGAKKVVVSIFPDCLRIEWINEEKFGLLYDTYPGCKKTSRRRSETNLAVSGKPSWIKSGNPGVQ